MKRAAWLWSLAMLTASSCLTPCPAAGSWGSGGCAPQFAAPRFVAPYMTPTIQPKPASYSWKSCAGTSWSMLYLGETQLGGIDAATGVYRPLLSSGAWGVPGPAPVGAPAAPAAPLVRKPAEKPEVVTENYGLDLSKMGKVEAYSVNGHQVEAAEAVRAIEGDSRIPNDAKLPRVTAVGGDAALRQKIGSDLAGKPVVFQGYPADSYAVKPFKLDQDDQFKANGFKLILQAPDGEVKQSFYRYDLDEVAGAVRRMDPNYDPNRDNPKPPIPPPSPVVPADQQGLLVVLLIVAGIVVVVLVKRTADQRAEAEADAA